MAVKPKRTVARASQRYTSAEFQPYVTALGQLALSWNDLQESLAGLFWTSMLTAPPQAGDVVRYTALRVWHAVKSDRSQRDMLKASINHQTVDWGRPKFVEDANWLLARVESLETTRNDAIHSPLFHTERSLYGTAFGASSPDEKIAPAAWLFNPRATSLARRGHLLNELRYCRDYAIKLSDFARAIDSALVNRGTAKVWPDRPSIPKRGKQKVATKKRSDPQS